MNHVSKDITKSAEGSFIKQSIYKPYQILGNYKGYIWNDEEKISVFKTLGHRMLRLQGNSYYTYTVGFAT